MLSRPLNAGLVLGLTLSLCAPAAAQDAPEWARGLEDLMTMEVSSVSRKVQRLSDTSAAVFVLTRDEIHRSGMRTIPDLLRLVPGVHVAALDGNKWAVTTRGFNSRQSNKLHVTVDGRSIYTPHFAGVFWDAIDVPIDAIERIEVIRGPGASIWGANAVNGVINIITTAPVIQRETRVTASTGSLDRTSGGVLHQSRLGDNVEYRLFANTARHGGLEGADGASLNDPWEQHIGGGGMKVRLNTRDEVEVSARYSDNQSQWLVSEVRQLAPFASDVFLNEVDSSSWAAMARWTRQLPRQGQLDLETYVDEWRRHDHLDSHRKTISTALTHRLGLRGRHDFIWGGEYRRTVEDALGSLTFSLSPAAFNHDLVSGFAQDDIALGDGRAHAVLGTKVEHREFSGWTLQPTARLHYRFTPAQSAWTAVSRAFRAADRAERGMNLPIVEIPNPMGPSMVMTLVGNPAISGEWLTAYEAGYRTALGGSLTLDLAAYYNDYDDLQGVSVFEPQLRFDGFTPYLHLPMMWHNAFEAASAGGEASLVYSPVSPWKLTGGYTLFTVASQVHQDAVGASFEGGAAPKHQVQIRSSLSLTKNVDVDATWLAVGSLMHPATDGPAPVFVPSYKRLDARVAWRPAAGPLELSLVGQNLTDRRHVEFGASSSAVVNFGNIPRSVRASVGWQF